MPLTIFVFRSSWTTWLLPAIAATVVGIVCRFYMFDHKSSWVRRPIVFMFHDLEAFKCQPKPLLTKHTLSAACVSRAARGGGCHFDTMLLSQRLRLGSVVCLHLYFFFHCHCSSFSVLLHKGAHLKPLPAIEPDAHRLATIHRLIDDMKQWTVRINTLPFKLCLTSSRSYSFRQMRFDQFNGFQTLPKLS